MYIRRLLVVYSVEVVVPIFGIGVGGDRRLVLQAKYRIDVGFLLLALE